MNIERYGANGIVRDYDAGVIFVYERENTPDNPSPRKLKQSPHDKFNWDDDTYEFGEYLIHPFGDTNDLPTVIKNILFDNYMAPGLLHKKTQLLWGQGPLLYKEEYRPDSNGIPRPVRIWQHDKEIQDWLESWEYIDYLMAQCVDYDYINGALSRFIRNRGVRIGSSPFITELEHIPADRGRLATKKDSGSRRPTHVIVTDKSFNASGILPKEYRVYPAFDFRNPFAHPNSILYSNLYSFCMDYYTLSSIYGSLEWIRRSTVVPLILKALSDNSLNIKYHVKSPQAYWDAIEQKIKEDCTRSGKDYEQQMLINFEKALFRKITRVLGGDENVGKLWHTKNVLVIEGTNLIELGWEIEPIKQDIKDYVTANLDISKHADYAVATGIGLHPAIANISDSGKANGGSEQVYALQGYLLTGIDIPERIVLKAINYALRFNFPGKGLKMGFYHEAAQKQSDISPQNRIKEIAPVND